MKQKPIVPRGTKKHFGRSVQTEKEKIMLLNGISVETERPRKGTKCAFCGEPIGDFEFVKTSTNHQTVCYVHTECLRMRNYHETFYTPSGNKLPLFDNTRKATTKEQIIYTPEIEFDDNYCLWSTEKRAAFAAQFGIYVEHDCTVGGEGHVKSLINFHGLYEWYANLEKWVNMRADCCGHHINLSWYGMRADDVRKIRRNAETLFSPVEKWMERNPEQVERIFGRNFSRWAKNDKQYIHGSWLNLENDWNDKEARIEYRLPHFVSAKQIVWCAFMLKDWTKELRLFCDGKQDEHKTATAILKHIEKSASGKALYQRPERNGGAKKAKPENLPFDF